VSPETPTAERELQKIYAIFNELKQLGGIPSRPCLDRRAEHLTDAQRRDDNGEEYLMNLYLQELVYWEKQLRLWRRFAKRREQDKEPGTSQLDPADAVAALIDYLRGHLQRDLQDRDKPGSEIWPEYGQMVFYRSFINDVLQLLPEFEVLLRELRRGGKSPTTAPEEPAVTTETLRQDYKLVHRPGWMDLWMHAQGSLEFLEDEARWAPKKQQTSELNMNRTTRKKKQSAAAQSTAKTTKGDDVKRSRRPAAIAARNTLTHSLRTVRSKSLTKRARAKLGEGSITDASGLLRSARIAGRNFQST
jgi:hypothetical protein